MRLTEQEETLRIAAINNLLKRRKDYEIMPDVKIKSLICRMEELNNDTDLRNYFVSGLLIAITVPLVKIYFLSNDVFHLLKSNRDKLNDLTVFIERNTLRVV